MSRGRPEAGSLAGRPIRRILAIRRKALGDALVTLPALLRLHEALPAATIDLVVDRPFAPLLAGLARGLSVLPWPPPAGAGGWLRRLREARYDLVLDYLGSPRTAFWTAVTAAPLRVGYDLRGRGLAYNVRVPRNRRDGVEVAAFAGEAFLDPLRELGLAPGPWRPAGAVRPAPGSLGEDYRRWRREWGGQPRPWIGLMLSASWSAKAWPAREAARLATLLRDGGARPLVIPGPGDGAFVEALRRAEAAADFAPATDLLELADLLADLDMLVATDNGARHLAAALGVPTVTLFGPTDPRGWNPPGPDHVAVSRGVSCAPCDLTICPVPGHPCLDGLTAEAVAAAAWPVLARRSRPPR